MGKTYQIFVPEWVPLQNKGEEAIVRGIADVLFPDGNCEVHLLDMVDEYRFQDGIHVYPVKWFVSPWITREFGLGASWQKLRDSACSLTRNGLHKLYPAWVKRKCVALRATEKQMERLMNGSEPRTEKQRRLLQIINCHYIVAGHDGALDERVCHVIDMMRHFGTSCGVFGVEFRPSFRSEAVAKVLHATLRHSQFFYCRTRGSMETIERCFPDIEATLLPDPAFGMQPAPDEAVEAIIAKEGLESFFRERVVMCTCCEPAPIARYCFEETAIPDAKLAVHRQLFAELIQHIVAEHNVNILFLPHATGPGTALDDRRIAIDILRRADLPPTRARMLNTECTARELKGLIGRAEFLVAERIHSIIGATGVHTPFLCMGSCTDRRIHGIIDEMLGMGTGVYFLNRPSLSDLKAKFDSAWEQRRAQRTRLTDISIKLAGQLEHAGAVMRRSILRGDE